MASPAEVSPALVGRLIDVLLVEGYTMPTSFTEAQAAMERTTAAAAGLVNAFTGADPFEGLAATPAALRERLRNLSPVDDPDAYRTLLAELMSAEERRGDFWKVLESVETAAAPAVQRVAEVYLNDIVSDSVPGPVPDGLPLRLMVGHLPVFADGDLVRRIAWRWPSAPWIEVVGTGVGADWLAEQLARAVTEERRAISG